MINIKKIFIDQKIMVKGMNHEVFTVKGVDAISNMALVSGDWSQMGFTNASQWVSLDDLIECVQVPVGKYSLSTEQIKDMLNDLIGIYVNTSRIAGVTNKISVSDATRVIRNVASKNNIELQ